MPEGQGVGDTLYRSGIESTFAPEAASLQYTCADDPLMSVPHGLNRMQSARSSGSPMA
jgi:hypothetical protein